MTGGGTGPSSRPWWPWATFVLATVVLLFRPLLGLGVLLPIDIAELFAPWRFAPESGFDRLANPLLSDTLDVHNHFASLAADIRAGNASFWDRSVGGGIPSLKAGLPVFNWVYLIVPAWYAPALSAAVRTVAAAGLTYGLTRRMGLERGPATVSGIAFALCGFMVAWSGWPQANVAALVPGVFWFVESLVRAPRLRLAVGFAAVIALMLWSNFPVITVYTLLVAGGYALYRLVSTRGATGELRRWARAATIAGLGAAGGLGLSIYHVLHFGENLRWADTGPRERLPADTSLGAEYLPSFLLPNPYGASHDGQVFWAPSQNWVEIQSYAGLAVIALALLSFGHRAARSGVSGSTARTGGIVRAWWVIIVLVGWLTYVGGPLTEVVNSIPAVGFSTIGRARVLANLGLAVLAGFGLQAWLDARAARLDVDLRAGIRQAMAVVVGASLLGSPLVWSWMRTARDAGFLKELVQDAAVPVVLAAVMVGVLWLLRSRADGRAAALAVPLVTLIVTIELIVGLGAVATVVDRDAADLHTAAHDVAIASLAPGERMLAEGRVFLANTGQTTGLDDLRTNGFTPPGWREVFRAIDPDHFRDPGTVSNPYFATVDLANPALGRLGIGVWAADPQSPVHGPRVGEIGGDERHVVGPTPVPGASGFVPEAGLRAIGIDLIEGAVGRLSVEITGSAGEATGQLALDGRAGVQDIVVAGPLTPGAAFDVVFRFEQPDDALPGARSPVLRGTREAITFQTVADGDGWTIVHSEAVVIYDRLESVGARLEHAVQEASRIGADVHGDPADVAFVAPGHAAGLGLPTAAPVGARGAATVVHAEGDELIVEVVTSDSALVVIAQPDYPGWTATIDGEVVPIVRVDASFPAVAVPAGESVIELRFEPSRLRPALLGTFAAVVLLAVVWVFGARLDERWGSRP